MRTRLILALLFLAGLVAGLARFYGPKAEPDSTPPGLRELLLASIQNGRLDITRLALAAPWDRVCLLPGGTSNEEAHRRLPSLPGSWHLRDFSAVSHAPVTALMLFGGAPEPVGVADLPSNRLQVPIGDGACFAKAAAKFPAR